MQVIVIFPNFFIHLIIFLLFKVVILFYLVFHHLRQSIKLYFGPDEMKDLVLEKERERYAILCPVLMLINIMYFRQINGKRFS